MSIKRNFVYQLGYELLILLLPLAVTPYISRTLGTVGVGEYSYSLTIAQYFVLFSMLGIKNYGNRLIAQSRDDKNALDRAFSSLLSAHLLISAVVCVVYYAYCRSSASSSYALMQAPLVISAVFDVSWVYFGLEKFKLVAVTGSALKAMSAGLIFALVRDGQDVWKYCLIMALCFLAQQLVLCVPLGRYVRLVKPTWAEITAHIKPLTVLFLPAVAVSIYKQMDKVMLGLMSTRSQLGCYQYADTAVGTPMTVIEAFGGVMLPRMSYLAKRDAAPDSDRYLSLSMKYVMGLSIPMGLGLSAVATVFAPLFFGKAFTLSGQLMQWLAITVPFIAFSNVIRTQFLLPNNRDKDFVVSVCAGAVCNFAVNLCLIPMYGAMGATIGTIVTEILVCMVQVFAVRKELPLMRYIRSVFPFAVFGGCMFYIVRAIGTREGISWKALGLQLVIGAALYMALAGGYLVLTKDTVFIGAVKEINKRMNSGWVSTALVSAVLFLELFLAIPFDYVSTLPRFNKIIYCLQALAALVEVLLVVRTFVCEKGNLQKRTRFVVDKYSWMSILLIAFVAYNWVITFAFHSLPLATSTHYPVQVCVLLLGVSRAYRHNDRAASFIIALYFWLAIIANSAVFILKPEGLYMSSPLNGISHICYLFGLDNQFGKIYFAGFALIWFYEERYAKSYFMTLSSLLTLLYVYFHWENGTGVIVSLALVLLVLLYNLRWLRWTLSMKAFLLAIVLIIVSIYSQTGVMYDSEGLVVREITEVTGKSVTFSGRMKVWEAAVEKIEESMVFGYGRVPENLQVSKEGVLLNAHNQVLQVWLDGGIVGVILFAASFVCADYNGAGKMFRIPEIRILFIGIFTSMLYFMMEVGTMLPMFLCMLLICLCAGGSEKRETLWQLVKSAAEDHKEISGE